MSSARLHLYRPEMRPFHTLNAMHGVASEYHGITKFPLTDALGLLIQKPIVFCFLLCDDITRLYRRVFSNFSDRELQPVFDTIFPAAGNRESVLSSMFTIELPRPSNSVLSASRKVLLCLHRITESADGSVDFEPYEKLSQHGDTALVEQFIKLVAQDISPSTVRVLETIEAMASDQTTGGGPSSALSENLSPRSLSPKEEGAILERIRGSVITIGLSDLPDNPLVGAGAGNPITNAFCVVRRALPPRRARLGTFSYTAQIILAEFQRDEITAQITRRQEDPAVVVLLEKIARERLEVGVNQLAIAKRAKNLESIVDQVLKDVELPLGDHYRSIADSVFGSGMSDFTYEPYGRGRDICRGEPYYKDEARRSAEQLIFLLLPKKANSERHIFYIAVHVGGTPWIALFSLAESHGEEIPDDVWERNYHLYRLAPQIANRVRAAAQGCYAECLATKLEETMASVRLGDPAVMHDALAEINEYWLAVTAYFPYRSAQLRLREQGATETGERAINLPGGVQARVAFLPNPNACFNEHPIAFDPLDVRILEDRIAIAADRAVAEASRISSAQLLEQADLAHTSKNIMTNITSAIRTANDPRTRAKSRGEALVSAEQFALFFGQYAGAVEQLLLAPPTLRLSNLHLDEVTRLVNLGVRYLTAVSQLLYRKNRLYFVGNAPFVTATPSDFLSALKKEIQTIYNKLGRGNLSSEWEFRKDPIFCALFVLFRELVDNMRPREDEKDALVKRYLDIDCRAAAEPEGTVVITLRQRIPRAGIFSEVLPFSGADTSKGIERFNRRYGRSSTLRFAEITSIKPESTNEWHIFDQHILLLRQGGGPQ